MNVVRRLLGEEDEPKEIRRLRAGVTKAHAAGNWPRVQSLSTKLGHTWDQIVAGEATGVRKKSSAKKLAGVGESVVARERWCFTERELADKQVLQGCRGHDEFIASVHDAELGVLIYRNGDPTNRWEDGTAGVPEDVQMAANEEDSLVKPRSMVRPQATGYSAMDQWRSAEDDTIADNWRDVEVHDDGSFNIIDGRG